MTVPALPPPPHRPNPPAGPRWGAGCPDSPLPTPVLQGRQGGAEGWGTGDRGVEGGLPMLPPHQLLPHCRQEWVFGFQKSAWVSVTPQGPHLPSGKQVRAPGLGLQCWEQSWTGPAGQHPPSQPPGHPELWPVPSPPRSCTRVPRPSPGSAGASTAPPALLGLARGGAAGNLPTAPWTEAGTRGSGLDRVSRRGQAPGCLRGRDAAPRVPSRVGPARHRRWGGCETAFLNGVGGALWLPALRQHKW